MTWEQADAGGKGVNGIFVMAIPHAVGQVGLYIVAIVVGTLVTSLAVMQLAAEAAATQEHKDHSAALPS